VEAEIPSYSPTDYFAIFTQAIDGQFLVLRKGKLVGCGNHDQLMVASPAYRRIFQQYD